MVDVDPGLRSSRIDILDTKPDPRRPHLVKTIEPDELANWINLDLVWIAALVLSGGALLLV